MIGPLIASPSELDHAITCPPSPPVPPAPRAVPPSATIEPAIEMNRSLVVNDTVPPPPATLAPVEFPPFRTMEVVDSKVIVPEGLSAVAVTKPPVPPATRTVERAREEPPRAEMLAELSTVPLALPANNSMAPPEAGVEVRLPPAFEVRRPASRMLPSIAAAK